MLKLRYAIIATCFNNHRVDESLTIKVADFGLARDVYEADYYRQQRNGKIPVKWMAPEALNDKISNQKTDIVSSHYTYVAIMMA